MSTIEELFSDQATATAREVSVVMRCSTQTVRASAAKYGVGLNLGGRAGWRFTEADVRALLKAMRPAKQVTERRRRRAA